MKQFTFNANGGVDDTLVIFLPEGNQLFPEVTAPIHPDKRAIFKGWGPDPTGEPYTEEYINVTANVTFYAIWDGITPAAETYTVVLRPNGGAGESILEYKDAGTTYRLPETLPSAFTPPPGYAFGGWSESLNGLPISQVQMNKDYVFYVIWNKSSGGGGSGSANRYLVETSPYGETAIVKIDSRNTMHIDPKTQVSYVTPSTPLAYYVPTKTTIKYKDEVVKVINGPVGTYTIEHEDWYNYSVEMIAEDYINTKYPHPYGDVTMDSASQIKYEIPTPPDGKQFKGWAFSFNTAEASSIPSYDQFNFHPLTVPVFRKGDPQYSLTLKSNTEDEGIEVIENIPNEALFIDDNFIQSHFGSYAPEGMRCVGVSKNRKGSPLFYDWLIMTGDTTLYGIYAKDE